MDIPNNKPEKKSTPAELAAFLAAHPSRRKPSRSQMEPYWAEIARLNATGYSLSLIQEFLKKVNVTVSRTAIHNFLKTIDPK